MALATATPAEEVSLSARGERLGVLDIFRDCDVCPEMVVLPLGSFTMGSSEEEATAARRRLHTSRNIDPDEAEAALRHWAIARGIDPDADPARTINPFLNEVPAHRVSIDRPIAMGRNEVTREEWAACVADGGCAQGLEDMPREDWPACLASPTCVLTPDDRIRFRLPDGPHPTHPRAPMTGITHHEMTDYTSWLNRKIGATVYRLPTEAEWEYVARAGTTTRFAQGDTLTLDQANFMAARREIRNGKVHWDIDPGTARQPVPVDSLDAANAWGLRHMSGNVSEFTSSCGDGPHRGLASSSQYLAADASRTSCKRSVKGGMYTGNVELARPARRVAITETHWSPSLGFRVVRDLAHPVGE